MTRTRYLAVAVLAVLASGCDAAQTFAPDTDTDVDAESAILAGTGMPFLDGSGGGSSDGVPLFDELAQEIPGFGGLYRRRECGVVVVLTAGADVQAAINIVHAALAPIHPCHGQVQVVAARGQFTYIELQRYYAAARPVLELRGVHGIAISYQLNRLVITVAARSVVGTVRDALDRLGIPADAVVFNVRNAGITRTTTATRRPTGTRG